MSTRHTRNSPSHFSYFTDIPRFTSCPNFRLCLLPGSQKEATAANHSSQKRAQQKDRPCTGNYSHNQTSDNFHHFTPSLASCLLVHFTFTINTSSWLCLNPKPMPRCDQHELIPEKPAWPTNDSLLCCAGDDDILQWNPPRQFYRHGVVSLQCLPDLH